MHVLQVLNHAVEFTGPGVSTLSIDQRLTIANMTTEWGALTGLFPVDSTTVQWIRQRLGKVATSILPACSNRSLAAVAYIQGRGPAGVVSDGNIEGFEAGQYRFDYIPLLHPHGQSHRHGMHTYAHDKGY